MNGWDDELKVYWWHSLAYRPSRELVVVDPESQDSSASVWIITTI